MPETIADLFKTNPGAQDSQSREARPLAHPYEVAEDHCSTVSSEPAEDLRESPFAVESGFVPPPRALDLAVRMPFEEMKPGDSFRVPHLWTGNHRQSSNNLRARVSYFQSTHPGRRLTVRTVVEDGEKWFRVYRLEDSPGVDASADSRKVGRPSRYPWMDEMEAGSSQLVSVPEGVPANAVYHSVLQSSRRRSLQGRKFRIETDCYTDPPFDNFVRVIRVS